MDKRTEGRALLGWPAQWSHSSLCPHDPWQHPYILPQAHWVLNGWLEEKARGICQTWAEALTSSVTQQTRVAVSFSAQQEPRCH